MCRCVFEGIRADIPFDRFLEIEADVRERGTLEDAEMRRIILDCTTAEAGGTEVPG